MVSSPAERVRAAHHAAMVSFILNGFGFASWVSRIPDVRDGLGLSNGRLGLLLLAIAAGSVITLPSSGVLIHRYGVIAVLRTGVTAASVGLVLAALGAGWWHSVSLTAVALVCYGLGVGVWDVAMNVEAGEVERTVGRPIMSRFHAGFSLGTVLAAGLGALVNRFGVRIEVHLGLVALAVLVAVQVSTGAFLSTRPESSDAPGESAWRAWLEGRTIVVGLMVFALAITEGAANDWLALALIDGYGVATWVGVAGFAVFVTAMTAGRLAGPALLARWRRVPVLWTTMAAAVSGLLLLVYGGGPVLITLGIVLWGYGASLGFPVGMSAAAEDPARAAARVSVVSTIAYSAFLAGPPLLGFVADRVGTLHSLLVIAVLLVPSALLVPAARERPAS